ncbi:MAG TPA: DNA mismatch repair protein MutS, partial [Chitinophagales bacterium]|nr:DNA mismatch repair protein MutS [Chitinophagales bacterium]
MSKPKEVKETPLMQQYNKIKQTYPDAILLFRVGDFYETFGSDAVKAAEILGIVLTKRANGSQTDLELAGFPHHSVDTYLPKLVKAGYRVAICEQLEDPKMTKTIVKRGVTELITPGVTVNDKILDHKANNFLASVFYENDAMGIAFLDISTGEFFVAQGNLDYLDKLFQSYTPSEVVFPKFQQKKFNSTYANKFYTYAIDDWVYQDDYLEKKLLNHFQVQTLKGFGLDNLALGIKAAGACLQYLNEAEQKSLDHITQIQRIENNHFVWLDRFTARNLELVHSMHEKGVTLLNIIDKTVAPMGSRLMRRWVAMPLKNKVTIDERLQAVEYLIKEQDNSNKLSQSIKTIGDLERIISKVSLLKISPRELNQLKKALSSIADIQILCQQSENITLKKIGEQINLCSSVKDKIEVTITDDAPVAIQKGNAVKIGISEELDTLRAISLSGKDYLTKLQNTEIEKTGISSLKIGFNNVFGYFLEVRNTHKEKVPETWIRKQTLVSAERYITPELKEYEEKILGAEEKIQKIEEQIFTELIHYIIDYIKPIQLNAQLVAQLDCLLSFATVALKNN